MTSSRPKERHRWWLPGCAEIKVGGGACPDSKEGRKLLDSPVALSSSIIVGWIPYCAYLQSVLSTTYYSPYPLSGKKRSFKGFLLFKGAHHPDVVKLWALNYFI
ncbi:hypothetical protein NPIL_553521 [Nephila pilipes]|uniref:Uncharacterized protein n=1 Tax=Nephila pilipes TaxID=299642 RepID=A0A8X6I545_NEPPI|nr:hypothetical protein NPIL_553521 [Nephila pilipes]